MLLPKSNAARVFSGRRSVTLNLLPSSFTLQEINLASVTANSNRRKSCRYRQSYIADSTFITACQSNTLSHTVFASHAIQETSVLEVLSLAKKVRQLSKNFCLADALANILSTDCPPLLHMGSWPSMSAAEKWPLAIHCQQPRLVIAKLTLQP